MEDVLGHPRNFIEEIIEQDIKAGKNGGRVHTRLPPEPNGWLHIGHAKNIYINCGTALKYGGLCNLRFDDTNPTKEDASFVEAIKQDIRWLGFDWTGGLFFGSSYFEQCYQLAEKLIISGDAFVCDLSQEEMKRTRGTLTRPGANSPYRDRSAQENLDLFRRMRAGEFENGARVLRAKIDMASPNMNMRDPALYRIIHMRHHQTGDAWCIYPMYDFAHPIQDAIEGITHSMCSLEYEDHRPLYNWVVDKCGFAHKPRQIESARLNITKTVMSKRFLRQIVESGLVSGWDDPRMPTLAGMRRRGYTPEAILDFIERAGVAKAYSVVDAAMLEHCVREDLSGKAPRAMAVLRPLKVTLTNWPQGLVEEVEMEYHPDRPELGSRKVPFGGTLYVEREDFMAEPAKKFFRLFPGGEVRLKSAYIIKCEQYRRDENGAPCELLCSVDLASKSGTPGAERKVKGTLHWLPECAALPAQFRLYEPMIREEGVEDEEDAPEEDAPASAKPDYVALFNRDSLEVLHGFIEPGLATAAPGDRFQFIRQGYYCKDPDSTPALAVFNRAVSLKDSFAKEVKA